MVWTPLLFFYKDGFGIKKAMKVDMPLHKISNETENQEHSFDCLKQRVG